MSRHHNYCVATVLHICREDMDYEFIANILPDLKGFIRKQGDALSVDPEPGLLKSSGDSRWSLDRWSCLLTGNQSKGSLEQQLDSWLQKLYPLRGYLQKLVEVDYWIVIDCRLSNTSESTSSIQFRINRGLLIKLSKINVDIDFTVW